MWCQHCDEGDVPHLVDIDGVRGSKSGSDDVCWAHSYEDDWVPCQARAAEDHAEVEQVRGMTGCRKCHDCLESWHHWLADPDPGGRWEYVCKHCPAKGDGCAECGGDGCADCDGEGVLAVTITETAEPKEDES